MNEILPSLVIHVFSHDHVVCDVICLEKNRTILNQQHNLYSHTQKNIERKYFLMRK